MQELIIRNMQQLIIYGYIISRYINKINNILILLILLII